jgi:quercetin dioxygenase-like cupin family protein
MEATVLYTPDLEGSSEPSFTTDADVVILREETPTGAKSMLVRLRPGGEIVPHVHTGTVQHFVLGGLCECDGKTLTAGTYAMYPPHASIGRISSRDGAELLILLDPESR